MDQAAVGDHSVSDQLGSNRSGLPPVRARGRTARSSGNSEAHVRAACAGPVGTSTSPWGLGLQQKSLTASPLQFSVSQLGTAHSWLLPSCPGKEEQQRVATIPRAAWLVARSASPARGFMRVFTAAAWSLPPRSAIRCVWFGTLDRENEPSST